MFGRAPAASAEPDNMSRASTDPSVRSSVPAIDNAAPLLSADTSLETELAGADLNGGLCTLQGQWAAVQGFAHQNRNAACFDRQALIDGTRNGPSKLRESRPAIWAVGEQDFFRSL